MSKIGIKFVEGGKIFNVDTNIETNNGDKVVVKQLEAVETTKSGIVLTGGAKEKPQEAEVIAVGPGTEEVKMEVAQGQKVIYSKYAGTNVKMGDEEYIIVKQGDILAIVE